MPFQKNIINTEADAVDVLIVGAGVAGCAAALFLQKAGYQVALLQQQQQPTFKVGESLPPVANKLLQQLGLWEKFKAQQHLPCYGNKSTWGSDTPQVHDFLASPYGHGWHINRLKFEQLLLDEVIEQGTQVIHTTQALQIVKEAEHWQLNTGSGMLKAGFLMDAAGRHSHLPKQLGIKRRHSDKQLALCAFFEGIHIKTQFSFIEAVPQGWWYTAPLPDGRVVVSLFTLPGCFTQKPSAQQSFLLQLQSNPALQNLLLGKAPLHCQLYNAGASILQQSGTNNYAAIGDAALTFDPLSSHGMVMAMTTARDAAAAYHQYRQGQAQAFANYCQNLQQVFAHYQQNKQHIYASETRWSGEKYWKQKQALKFENQIG